MVFGGGGGALNKDGGGGGVCVQRELVDGNYVGVIITSASCIYCIASPCCPLLHFGVELWSSRVKWGRGEVMDIRERVFVVVPFSNFFFKKILHFQLNEEITFFYYLFFIFN